MVRALVAVAAIVLATRVAVRGADAAPAATSPVAPGRAAASPPGPPPSPASAAAASRMSRDALLDALGADDLHAVEHAVATILQLPASGADPDVLFAAGRACEDKLLDPARAAALYDRIVADHPTARVATAAARRIAVLHEQIGPHGEGAAYAAELAHLTARADAQPAGDVIRRGEQLAAASWPGAPTAALWLADWLRRSGRLAEAQARYADLVARWPALPEAQAALRNGAGCALDAHDWALAEALAHRLSVITDDDRAVRDDVLAAAARGRRRDRWYVLAWLAAVAACSALVGSLAEAILRSPPGTRRSALRPPIEIVFLAPVAAVLIGLAFTAHRLIAPAVATISLGGLILAWLSGAALEQLRSLGRPQRIRGVAHVALCLVAVLALAYIALTRDHLLDLLIETVRFGPET